MDRLLAVANRAWNDLLACNVVVARSTAPADMAELSEIINRMRPNGNFAEGAHAAIRHLVGSGSTLPSPHMIMLADGDAICAAAGIADLIDIKWSASQKVYLVLAARSADDARPPRRRGGKGRSRTGEPRGSERTERTFTDRPDRTPIDRSAGRYGNDRAPGVSKYDRNAERNAERKADRMPPSAPIARAASTPAAISYADATKMVTAVMKRSPSLNVSAGITASPVDVPPTPTQTPRDVEPVLAPVAEPAPLATPIISPVPERTGGLHHLLADADWN